MSNSPPTLTEKPKAYTFSCHCARIRFSIRIDPSAAKPSKCNCSICLKSGRISIPANKDEDFTLLSPSSMDEVPKHQFGQNRQNHCFCRVCGVFCFAYGRVEIQGKGVDLFSFNALTLEPGQDWDLRGLKLEYWDGRRDAFAEGPKEEPGEGGVW
ncbi:hypothetical protein QBC34DRAFT_441880 [Podospora aff. communis PSN243]|uniref:CENP-V/GFA domain-containing protein n=1 Tax=Podospora aff. communis PSN243 TaxID=3040156 RepID=A0AAV9GBY1_9PEZI|nr:hypothetical protein QBC34DRAFT_441880 [Podospora aff. communis PSN243]